MIRRVLELAGALLGAAIAIGVVLELARWLYALAGELTPPRSTDPRSPERGSGAYPNTYGVRLAPLTADELAGALEGERALARRLLELGESTGDAGAGDPLGSVPPAVDVEPLAGSYDNRPSRRHL